MEGDVIEGGQGHTLGRHCLDCDLGLRPLVRETEVLPLLAEVAPVRGATRSPGWADEAILPIIPVKRCELAEDGAV